VRQAVNRTQRHSRTAPPRQWWPDPPRTATKPPALSLVSSLLPTPLTPNRPISLTVAFHSPSPLATSQTIQPVHPKINRGVQAHVWRIRNRVGRVLAIGARQPWPSAQQSCIPPPSPPKEQPSGIPHQSRINPASIPHQSPFLPMSACGDVNSSPNSDPSTAGGGGGELAGRGRRGACASEWERTGSVPSGLLGLSYMSPS